MKKTKLFVYVCLVQLMVMSFIATGAFAVGPTNSNPLSDVRVRQAIAYAIDMDTIVETLLEGKALVADSQTRTRWKIEGLNPYSYNPEKARELLAAANWDPNYTLDAVVYYGDQLTMDFATAIQAYLDAVGIKMSFRKLEGDLATQLWTAPADPINGPFGRGLGYLLWRGGCDGHARILSALSNRRKVQLTYAWHPGIGCFN